MNSYKYLTTACVICLLLVSVAFSQETDRNDLGYAKIEKVPVSVESEASMPGETYSGTVLDPRIEAVNASFSNQISQLEEDILFAANYEEVQSLQQKVKALKLQWSVAAAEVQLEIAQEIGDEQAVTRIQENLNELRNPPQRVHTLVERDPATGEALKGGSR
jgi:hypothetical protein